MHTQRQQRQSKGTTRFRKELRCPTPPLRKFNAGPAGVLLQSEKMGRRKRKKLNKTRIARI